MKLKSWCFCWSTFVQIMLLQVSPAELTSISFSVLWGKEKENSETTENNSIVSMAPNIGVICYTAETIINEVQQHFRNSWQINHLIVITNWEWFHTHSSLLSSIHLNWRGWSTCLNLLIEINATCSMVPK